MKRKSTPKTNNPGIDPITVEIIRCALDNIGDEVGIAMTRCAKNVNFSEAHDYSAGIFDYKGRIATLSTIEAIPIHMGAAKFSVIAALEYFGIDDLHPAQSITCHVYLKPIPRPTPTQRWTGPFTLL